MAAERLFGRRRMGLEGDLPKNLTSSLSTPRAQYGSFQKIRGLDIDAK